MTDLPPLNEATVLREPDREWLNEIQMQVAEAQQHQQQASELMLGAQSMAKILHRKYSVNIEEGEDIRDDGTIVRVTKRNQPRGNPSRASSNRRKR